MKKISAVLLVLVLVGSVVFAGFTGSATTSLGYNLDTGVYGFANATATTVDLTVLKELGAKKGEGAIYAEINATAKITWDGTANVQTAVAVDSANIIGDGWKLGLLKSSAAADWAVSTIDYNSTTEKYSSMKPSTYVVQNVKGVNLTVKDYAFSVGLTGTMPGVYNVYGTVATPEMEVADGMKAKFAAAGLLSDAAKAASASAKVTYAAEDYSASLAADVVYAGGVKADVAVQSKFAPATVDVYFATDTNQGPAYNVNVLSAKVLVDLEQVDLTVTGYDLLTLQKIALSAKLAASAELAVTARGAYTLSTSAWEAGADVVYTAADYTATLNTTYASAGTLAVTLKAVSTKLVNGATLTAQYKVADILAGKGAITAEAKVAF